MTGKKYVFHHTKRTGKSNNQAISINVLYVPGNSEKIRPKHILKQNSAQKSSNSFKD